VLFLLLKVDFNQIIKCLLLRIFYRYYKSLHASFLSDGVLLLPGLISQWFLQGLLRSRYPPHCFCHREISLSFQGLIKRSRERERERENP